MRRPEGRCYPDGQMTLHALAQVAPCEDGVIPIAADDVREIARLTNASSSSVARNAFFLEQVATDAAAQADLVEGSVAMLDEMAANMDNVVEGARRSLEIVRATGETSVSAAETAREALGDLASAAETVDRFDDMIASLWQRVDGIGGAIEAIEDISERSHLLSINATIEAAHAGDYGRTFAVIAGEIGKLANSTTTFTEEIETLLRTVRSQVEALRELSRAARRTTASVRTSSQKVESALTTVGSAAQASREQITAIAAAAAQQNQTLDELVKDVRNVASATTSTLRTLAQARELQIGDLNSQLYAVIGRYRIGTFVDRATEVGEAAAQEVEAILERGIELGWYALDDLLEPRYRELRGREVLQLGRLFDVSRARKAFDPPKFGTTYDAKIDVALCDVVDRYTDRNPDFNAVCVLDNNAFHVAHYRLMRAPITGDAATDRANNRVKRMFEGRTALRCGRVGLPGAEAIAPRSGRRAFEAAGIALRRPAGRRPYLVQSYARDTGEIFNDLSLALYVRDQHFGALSIAYPADTV